MEMDGLLDAVGRDADADGLGGAGLDVSGGRLASGFDSGIPVPDHAHVVVRAGVHHREATLHRRSTLKKFFLKIQIGSIHL